MNIKSIVFVVGVFSLYILTDAHAATKSRVHAKRWTLDRIRRLEKAYIERAKKIRELHQGIGNCTAGLIVANAKKEKDTSNYIASEKESIKSSIAQAAQLLEEHVLAEDALLKLLQAQFRKIRKWSWLAGSAVVVSGISGAGLCATSKQNTRQVMLGMSLCAAAAVIAVSIIAYRSARVRYYQKLETALEAAREQRQNNSSNRYVLDGFTFIAGVLGELSGKSDEILRDIAQGQKKAEERFASIENMMQPLLKMKETLDSISSKVDTLSAVVAQCRDASGETCQDLLKVSQQLATLDQQAKQNHTDLLRMYELLATKLQVEGLQASVRETGQGIKRIGAELTCVPVMDRKIDELNKALELLKAQIIENVGQQQKTGELVDALMQRLESSAAGAE